MTTIWLNHWFSTAYNIIALIRQGGGEYRIIGTNEGRESPIMLQCDEWYQEPKLRGEEYVDFCLDFCKEHGVDVFMPRRELVTISRFKERFTEMGVRVMVDDFEKVDILNQKDRAYELFKSLNIGKIPDYSIVTDVHHFKYAYETLIKKYDRVCFKFVRDEGGMSFHIIDNSPKDYASLFMRSSTRISLDTAVSALSERENFAPLMVMPFLSGDEISVDCLRTPSGTIAIPRRKNYSRVEKVFYDEEILLICRDFLEKIPLEMPCNIQFKLLNDVPYLLEVNTRMSGGVQMSCMASGINIPYIAVNKLLGKDVPWTESREEKSVTYIEAPLVL
ncbi:MAG: ATP-grasp domain-containing protein [Ruminococcus sp.]|nr:ATP-grasp domain-containing protein [Ruminococcus sp.]